MKPKNKVTLISFLLATLLGGTTLPAQAISASYRAQLERSGCTQVTVGQGCDIHLTKDQNFARQHPAPRPDTDTSEAGLRHGKADPDAARAVQSEILPKVRGKYLGQAVDIMAAQGWRRVGQDGNTWTKAGFRAFLNQDGDSGRVVGVTID